MMSVSYIVLWLLVLSLTVFAIVISKKPKRVLGAYNTGLPVGSVFPKFDIQSVVKQIPFSVVHPERKETLLLFSSSMCSICSTVYPLFPYAEQKYHLKAQVIMEPKDGQIESIIEKIDAAGLYAPVYALTPSIMQQVKLEGFPFAYYLSTEGIVLAKGVINTIADIDLLVSQGRRAGMKKLAG
jgi:hypothetical protein